MKTARLSRLVRSPYLAYAVAFNRVRCLLEAGRGSAAAEAVPAAEEALSGVDSHLQKFLLEALKGHVAAANGAPGPAASLLETALEGLAGLELLEYVAVVGLDLAVVYCRLDRIDDALRVATNAIPALEGLSYRGEAAAACGMLREAVSRREASEATLRAVRLRLGDETKSSLSTLAPN